MMQQFTRYNRGDEYLLEQAGQKFDLDNGAGWYRQLRPASKNKTPQALALAVQVFERVLLKYFVCLQKLIDLLASLESEQPPKIWLGETTMLELLSSQRFQSSP
jgi:hypothetical protein